MRAISRSIALIVVVGAIVGVLAVGYFAVVPPPGGSGSCYLVISDNPSSGGNVNGFQNGQDIGVTCGGTFTFNASAYSGYSFSYWSSSSVTFSCTTCLSTDVTIPTTTTTGITYSMTANFQSTTNTLSSSIQASPNSGLSPLAVSFSSAVTGGSAPYTYSWTFGDGGTSTSSTTSHTYQNAGVYLAQLAVQDSSGASSSTSVSVRVSQQVTNYTTTTMAMATTATTSTTASASPTGSGGTQPPGLPIAWTTSNMSVQAKTITSQILIPNGPTISNVQSTSQISYMAYGQSNGAVVQLGFSTSGPVNLSIQTSEAPSSVWANSTQITSWTYANGVLSISADPYTLTMFFPTPSSNIPESEIILILIVIVAFGAALGASLRRR